jgi:hypothetical protein
LEVLEAKIMLKEKIIERKPGILTYGITPPKASETEEKIREIASRQVERIKGLSIDALILYDIQDEKERVSAARPFPFMKTLDPALYSRDYLSDLAMPHIIYRCVGKYPPEELARWMESSRGKSLYSVFVGAASKSQAVTMTLSQAYELAPRGSEHFLLGGVAIPERHLTKNDEHLRVYQKMEQGCRYFVSQAVYNVEASKNFLSDYFFYCQEHEVPMVPIVFTLTPCGSLKTLQFMKWLGVNIPRWLENELVHSRDILDRSTQLSIKAFTELMQFGAEKKIPIGCNVESVSINKVEIEASIQLVKEISRLMTSLYTGNQEQ